jgi:hypothetical protein
MTSAAGRRALGAFLVLAAAFAALPARAEPATPLFGPMIDAFGTYDPQRTCDPTDKPGVRAFRNFVLSQYPDTGAGGISRSCSGGTSEHHEGRAWDWSVRADVADEKAAADEVIAWLLAADDYGNEAAMARRAGIMYLIWNRKIWSVWGGWQTYCVQKDGACVAPGSNQTRHPHRDHVHFSFTWAGAKKKTTFYKPDRSYVASIARGGSGYWISGRNGGVVGFGATVLGDRVGRTKASPVVAISPSRSGKGYYLLSKNGRVSAFGDAPHLGGARGVVRPAVALQPTSTGAGYYVLGADGRVAAFGDAVHHGELTAPSPAVSLLVTKGGYRIVTADGSVHAFGSAADLGGADLSTPVAAAAAAPSGYWLLGADGDVAAVGGAPDFGRAEGLQGVAVSLTPTKGGDGLWVVSDLGHVVPLGAAAPLGDLRP